MRQCRRPWQRSWSYYLISSSLYFLPPLFFSFFLFLLLAVFLHIIFAILFLFFLLLLFLFPVLLTLSHTHPPSLPFASSCFAPLSIMKAEDLCIMNEGDLTGAHALKHSHTPLSVGAVYLQIPACITVSEVR